MLKTILITIFLGIVFFLAPHLGTSHWFHLYFKFILVFFVAIGFFNAQLVQRAFTNNREKFIPLFLSTVVIRLILSILFVGTFVLLHISNARLFILDFFVTYLLYTSFEIYGLYANLHQNW